MVRGLIKLFPNSIRTAARRRITQIDQLFPSFPLKEWRVPLQNQISVDRHQPKRSVPSSLEHFITDTPSHRLVEPLALCVFTSGGRPRSCFACGAVLLPVAACISYLVSPIKSGGDPQTNRNTVSKRPVFDAARDDQEPFSTPAPTLLPM